ncbi:MAG: translocation/assembly module TamB domain-containing protein, partial [Candidatus Eiseniibacteriota bacterium]
PFLPEGLSLDGTAALTLDAGLAPDGALDVRLDVGIGPGRLTATLADTTQALDFAWSLAATAGADGVEVTLGADLDHVTGTRFGTVAAELALPEFTSLADTATVRTQPLTATASIQVVDLSPVAVLVPDLGRLAGRLQIDAEAAGTVGEPTVDATVALVDGAVDVPDAGLEVRDIQLAVQGNERGVVELTGSARSGGGALELSSSSSFGALEQRRATVQIRGNRFEVMNTREIRALVSPDLEVEINGDRVEVGGSITIPLTTVHLKEVPPGAAPRSGDVILVDAESDETPPPVDVFADLRVALGDSVSFQGFGLTAHMVGQLRVFQEPGKAPTATGEIEVRNGSYKAYGQDLTIGRQEDSGTNRDEAARIIFAGGPVDNPGLDLRAYRVADDGVVAGLAIGGTAKQPEITLFSEPAMPQGDALAYLMLGHPLGEGGGGGDEDLLTGAATSLGLKGGNLLARSLGSKVGLDEAGIESEGSYKEAAFVAGKYLTPSLYVSQSIGLFDRVSVFRLRYLLSSNWTVEAETGQGTGTDVLYRIERGE